MKYVLYQMMIYLITSYHEMKSAKQTHRIHTRPKIGLRNKIYTYICTTQLVDTTEKKDQKIIQQQVISEAYASP